MPKKRNRTITPKAVQTNITNCCKKASRIEPPIKHLWFLSESMILQKNAPRPKTLEKAATFEDTPDLKTVKRHTRPKDATIMKSECNMHTKRKHETKPTTTTTRFGHRSVQNVKINICMLVFNMYIVFRSASISICIWFSQYVLTNIYIYIYIYQYIYICTYIYMYIYIYYISII